MDFIERRRGRRALLGSYAALLLILVGYLVLRSALQEAQYASGWVAQWLWPLILLASLAGILQRRVPSILIAVFVGASVLLDVIASPGDSVTVDVLRYGTHMALGAVLFVVILRHLFSQEEIASDSVLGAACGFLLLALFFGQAFALVERLLPGSFSSIESGPSAREYFSIVTLTTLGYGDIVPTRPVARTIAGLAAFFGQFYIAVIVARLVALQVSQRRPSRGAEGDD